MRRKTSRTGTGRCRRRASAGAPPPFHPLVVPLRRALGAGCERGLDLCAQGVRGRQVLRGRGEPGAVGRARRAAPARHGLRVAPRRRAALRRGGPAAPPWAVGRVPGWRRARHRGRRVHREPRGPLRTKTPASPPAAARRPAPPPPPATRFAGRSGRVRGGRARAGARGGRGTRGTWGARSGGSGW